jgi:hypothetical protein
MPSCIRLASTWLRAGILADIADMFMVLSLNDMLMPKHVVYSRIQPKISLRIVSQKAVISPIS